MKNLFLALLAVAAVGFTSCGGDDGCDNSFAGTYTGTNDCSLAGSSDATITISGTDGSYSVSGGSLIGGTFEQDGCTLSFDETPLGTGEVVTITMPDSSSIRVVREITVLGETTETCTFTGTK